MARHDTTLDDGHSLNSNSGHGIDIKKQWSFQFMIMPSSPWLDDALTISQTLQITPLKSGFLIRPWHAQAHQASFVLLIRLANVVANTASAGRRNASQ